MEQAIAAVFTAAEVPFELTAFPVTPPNQGTALIAMEYSGVCGTDLHIHRGRLDVGAPRIIGHEMVGRVSMLPPGADTSLRVGDRVIVNVASPCGKCLLCRAGDSANCIHMGVTYARLPSEAPHLHGGYASHCYAPLENLILVPEALPALPVCVFACTGSTVLHAMRLCGQAGIGKPDTCVVQGTGPMGMFAIMYLKSMGARRIIASTYDCAAEQEKRILGFGATDIVKLAHEGEEGLMQKVQEATQGIGADFAMECSGNPHAFAQGLSLLRNRGAYSVPGQYSNAPSVPVPAQVITFKALQIIGSSQYDSSDVNAYLDFLTENPQLWEPIAELAACYPLSKVNDAFRDAKAGKNVKTVLTA